MHSNWSILACCHLGQAWCIYHSCFLPFLCLLIDSLGLPFWCFYLGIMILCLILFKTWPSLSGSTFQFYSLAYYYMYLIRTFCDHSFLDHLNRRLKWAFLIKICPVVYFLHFHLLLQNHWANFNQTWHKASLDEVIQVCSNKEPINSHIVNNGFLFS